MSRARVGAALVLVVAALLLAPAAALAHDSLVSVTPADGTTVTAGPETVVLEFSDVVEPLGTAVVVRGSDGREVGAGSTRVSGTTVTQDLEALTADGTYFVSYRVVSADGHPVTGTTSFVADGLGPAMTPVADLSTDVRPDESGMGTTLVWAVALVAGVAVVVVAVLRGRRRVRT